MPAEHSANVLGCHPPPEHTALFERKYASEPLTTEGGGDGGRDCGGGEGGDGDGGGGGGGGGGEGATQMARIPPAVVPH